MEGEQEQEYTNTNTNTDTVTLKNGVSMDDFNTGDIILFHHRNNASSWVEGAMSIFSNIIDWLTDSKYSHVGIIVKDPQFTLVPLKGIYLLESSYEPFPDVENHEYKIGVELEKFEDVYKDWKGSLYWRKLNCLRDSTFMYQLAKGHSVVHNRPYDILPEDWLKAWWKIKSGNEQKKKTFWCSALVAYMYVCWGFLSPCVSWTTITPKALGTENSKESLVFENCNIDKEIQIK